MGTFVPGKRAERIAVAGNTGRAIRAHRGVAAPSSVAKARYRNKCSGGGGIRTHGRLAASPVFKTGAMSRSATPPGRGKTRGNLDFPGVFALYHVSTGPSIKVHRSTASPLEPPENAMRDAGHPCRVERMTCAEACYRACGHMVLIAWPQTRAEPKWACPGGTRLKHESPS